MTEASLGELVGVHSCEIMDLVGVYGIVYSNVGGLGIAFYRILYIKHEHFVKYIVGERVLLVMIWSLSLISCGILAFLFILETSSYRTQMNICTGLSARDNEKLIDYGLSRGEKLLDTAILQKCVTNVCILMITLEFSIYIWFLRHRYQNDNGNIKILLTQDVIRERNVKNVVTFLGQFYCFVMDSAFLIGLLFFICFAGEYTNLFRALAVMARFMNFGLMSAVEVYSSPGLRSFMR
jgi:hypothetical protein